MFCGFLYGWVKVVKYWLYKADYLDSNCWSYRKSISLYYHLSVISWLESIFWDEVDEAFGGEMKRECSDLLNLNNSTTRYCIRHLRYSLFLAYAQRNKLKGGIWHKWGHICKWKSKCCELKHAAKSIASHNNKAFLSQSICCAWSIQ